MNPKDMKFIHSTSYQYDARSENNSTFSIHHGPRHLVSALQYIMSLYKDKAKKPIKFLEFQSYDTNNIINDIISFIGYHPTIVSYTQYDNHLQVCNMIKLFKALEQLDNLQTLDLSFISLGHDGVQQLVSLLQNDKCQITTLKLNIIRQLHDRSTKTPRLYNSYNYRRHRKKSNYRVHRA